MYVFFGGLYFKFSTVLFVGSFMSAWSIVYIAIVLWVMFSESCLSFLLSSLATRMRTWNARKYTKYDQRRVIFGLRTNVDKKQQATKKKRRTEKIEHMNRRLSIAHSMADVQTRAFSNHERYQMHWSWSMPSINQNRRMKAGMSDSKRIVA